MNGMDEILTMTFKTRPQPRSRTCNVRILFQPATINLHKLFEKISFVQQAYAPTNPFTDDEKAAFYKQAI